MSIIEVKNISKTIKEKQVLRDISFEIGEGECVALIGPNGAGKTTLLSCLLGDWFVTSGSIRIQGSPVTDSVLKKVVGILSQENAVPTNLRVSELIAFFQEIYPNSLSNQEIDALLHFSPEQKQQLAEKLSGGQKRLLSFVLVLIGRPSILFLDEPTTAMDTSTRQRFWEIVRDLKEKGVTIVYSSHYIEEVEHTADRILVLHQGQLLRDTTPFNMRSEEREKQFTIPKEYRAVVESWENVYGMEKSHDRLRFMTKEADVVWQALQKANCPIMEIEMTNKTLLNTLFDTTKEEA
ncbi:ATP-binding cassette domain-containing protein [Streptococcus sp. zg-86]|uniref:ATP-binding cassette domain-containing protein n=1 Tax=Streptococcus zhangguiae TaxID=2664091 RepID=A0A6I4RGF1_9STRE|nr:MULTISPECIES: ABC transporter ATP-binding protein [unclassified Streptococcus]MTB64467.1 ATP-binding cassette domain-containing protein [Streptococcus sp. zg-86]MTB90843.1 ATP-binding cassette domain-containing protein [Streptococcus sp. zg-36]MWV56454.1 ATP-binding cassette domain-containing protein [Streptococcus sp. zg-70]QTH47339.1 ABC transporter ATP-binding protein [Streptococcus sp. zg-86]